ncbi:hypothetical protein VSU16_16055 (plasmid) [Cetobacterium somerae]|uniref:hypothetical protein n=1 Tax=Cetobacterium somerae TaxID=188913 RepID=UPI002E7BC3C7|nr:hypothetical protein [Cetobacterium somerae]WVJ03341.1 hypothetical protein VSU16_16055 [Cetobacterium somerae]
MVKIKGLDSITKSLGKLEKNAKELNGTHEIPVEILFNNKFMRDHTNFDTFHEFVESIPSNKNFEDVEDEILHEHVCNFTIFSSWNEMFEKAGFLYAKTQLFKGVKF